MSAANATKIFGIRLGVDPKILIGGLVLLAAILFWYNSRTEDSVAVTPGAGARRNATPVSETPAARKAPSRRTASAVNDRGVLRMRPIDATHGDIDPTLRLDLLSRLASVEQGKIGRSVFEIGPAPQTAASAQAIKAPTIVPGPIAPVTPTAPAAPAVNVPLKYYGYAKPQEKSEPNRGLFLDGDNVLVATEGEVVKGHYMVVELTPTSARMEDTQLRQSQTLPVVPVAMQQ